MATSTDEYTAYLIEQFSAKKIHISIDEDVMAPLPGFPSYAEIKKKKETKVCDFCGPYEECDTKRHTVKHIEDLLVDSGVCKDDPKELKNWWNKKHKKDDPDSILLGYTPTVVWPAYGWRVAKYVRKII